MDDFIKPDCLYMNHAEAELFKRLRKRGEITFFGCTTCDACGTEIPKPKRFCSKNCHDAYAECCDAVVEFLLDLGGE